VAALKLHPYDVLLGDPQMPGEDGFTPVRRIRALPVAEGGTTAWSAPRAEPRPAARAAPVRGWRSP
jgi:CheY-like chemotaxis protein